MICSRQPRWSTSAATKSRVVPAISLTKARLWPHKWFKSVLFPAFAGPVINTTGQRWRNDAGTAATWPCMMAAATAGHEVCAKADHNPGSICMFALPDAAETAGAADEAAHEAQRYPCAVNAACTAARMPGPPCVCSSASASVRRMHQHSSTTSPVLSRR